MWSVAVPRWRTRHTSALCMCVLLSTYGCVCGKTCKLISMPSCIVCTSMRLVYGSICKYFYLPRRIHMRLFDFFACLFLFCYLLLFSMCVFENLYLFIFIYLLAFLCICIWNHCTYVCMYVCSHMYICPWSIWRVFMCCNKYCSSPIIVRRHACYGWSWANSSSFVSLPGCLHMHIYLQHWYTNSILYCN